MVVLRRSPYAVIEQFPADDLVRIQRTAASFGDVTSAAREVAAWAQTLSALPKTQLGILLDWRLTPMTSDPEILRVVITHTDALALSFARSAVLISAPLAPLQSDRVARAGAVVASFTDEAAARAHLRR